MGRMTTSPAIGTTEFGVCPATTSWTEHTSGLRSPVVRREVAFLDFTVAGTPLRQLVQFPELPGAVEEMTLLSQEWPAGAVHQLSALLGKPADDYDDGRTALLVCPVCCDLGCRALSAAVEIGATQVHWRQLGWQVNYKPFTDPLTPPLEFRFDRAQYQAVLQPLLDRYAELDLAARAARRPTGWRRWRFPRKSKDVGKESPS